MSHRMPNQRERLLLAQATTDVMTTLGGTQVYGHTGAGPNHQRGVMLAFADSEESVIHSETYWMEGDRQHFRYRVVARLTVERQEILDFGQ